MNTGKCEAGLCDVPMAVQFVFILCKHGTIEGETRERSVQGRPHDESEDSGLGSEKETLG